MLASLFGSSGARADAAGDRSPWGDWWFTPTPAGLSGVVTPDSALRITAVYACVRVRAESLAVLPFRLYRPRRGGGRQLVTDHWLTRLFCRRPNPYQTPFEWREMLQGHLDLRGNAYCRIQEDGAGGIASLLPLHPDRVTLEAVGDTEWRYRITRRDGTQETLRRDQVWHLRGLSADGVLGLSPIGLAAASLGEAATFESYSANWFRNNATPPAWIKWPGKFADKAARQAFREQIQEAQTDRHRGKIMVLDQGMELTALQISQRDMQFIEARAMKVTEIARLFRVPPHKIGDLSKATFSNIEQQSIEFWQDAIHPAAERWESSIECTLLGEDTELEVEFDMRGQMRGDGVSRSAYIHAGVLDGWLTRNEGRAMEGLDPLEGLDEPLVPTNERNLSSPDPSSAAADTDTEAETEGQAAPATATAAEPGDEAPGAEARLQQVVRANAGRMARRIAGGNLPTPAQLAEALGVPERMSSMYLSSIGHKAASVGWTEQTLRDDLMAFALLTWEVNPS